jgi:hypothetical protein
MLYCNISKNGESSAKTGLGGEMKLILAVAILLATLNTADAQPELGEARNNPLIVETLVPLFGCQEAVIRDDFFLARDEKKISSVVLDICSTQIDKAQDACGVVTGYDEDECETIIINLLRHNSSHIVKDIMMNR